MWFYFSTSGQKFTDLGFGSVYEGLEDYGPYANISTQAVMSLIKNIGKGVEDPSQVVLGTFEVDEYCIPQTDAAQGAFSHSLGEVYIILFNTRLLSFC